MERLLETVKEIGRLIDLLGYSLGIEKDSLPLYENANIYKDNKIVGSLSLEKLKLFYMKATEKKVDNMHINKMNLDGYRGDKRIYFVHVVINDDNFNIDNYNCILNDKNNYVGLSNKSFSVRSTKGKLTVVSFDEEYREYTDLLKENVKSINEKHIKKLINKKEDDINEHKN